ncbi:MAG: response regulator transcription factor [Acidobacteriia bacterium]|nr:response regulator transcription factor [Terriglobia bacterium]
MDTLVVCDTEPVAIEGIRGLLSTVEDLNLVAAETSLEVAQNAARELEPTLFLIDKAFGIHAVMDCLKTKDRQTGAVVWGVSLSESEALRFLQAGAAGVIRKTVPVDLLLECLRAVAAGQTWVEQDVLRDKDRPPRLARTSLTSREMQVMELVERGMKNKEIGSALGIRTGTVKIHLKHIFEKTGIRGRYGLALSGLKAKGLLALPEIGL